jgi:hypothetical protein
VRRAGAFGGAFLSSTLVVAAIVAAATARADPAIRVIDVPAAAVDLWIAYLVLFAAPVAACAGFAFVAGAPCVPSRIWLWTAISAFAALWFARLEPAHQFLSVRPHLSALGVAELGAIAAAAAIATAVSRRSTAALAVLGAAWLALAGLTRAVEPDRRRDTAAARLEQQFPAHHAAGDRSGRVLMIGVDGLDLRAVAWMAARGRLPAIQRLLRGGRFYQHDNRGMLYSAVIWTALYSGHPERDNRIGAFSKWALAGVPAPVAFLPRWGAHAALFTDEVLSRLPIEIAWRPLPVSTADSIYPPLWSIASQAGRRVGAFDPVPHVIVPERLNGFFAVAGDGGYQVHAAGRDAPVTLPYPASRANTEFAGDLEAADVAASLFRTERPDLGIFYTHFVDTAQHLGWDYQAGGHDAAPRADNDLGAGFDASSIRRAYDAADRVVATLVDAFGSDATVLLVSDHGWRYDDYEHFDSPFGMLAMTPAEWTGYGGVADVLAVAPTVLTLLGLPADASMAEAIAPLHARRTAEPYLTSVVRPYATEGPQHERLERLRSLGYLGGVRRPPPKRPSP